jgi:hypothetical protein
VIDLIKERRFTYRGQIKVSGSDLRLAKRGHKTCTIRLGTASVEGQELDLTDGKERLRVRVTTVEADRRYVDITDEEARADGVESRAALDLDLRRFYGTLDDAQPMTLIHFERLPGEFAETQTQLWS